MTKVIKGVRGEIWVLVWLLAGLSAGAGGQAEPAAQANLPKVAEALYLQLRNVGLDGARVYRVRDASLDRNALHITLEDGTIAFTEDVFGRVTGAFFEGEGEVLLFPPDKAERASMALFTGAAILEERFLTAYFRFNDDTFAQLQPFLRPTENAPEFVSQWNETARNLAEGDALRLLLTFSRSLPRTDGSAPEPGVTASEDRFVHARVQGRKLGTFDLTFDANATEQISAGQFRTLAGVNYYDLWTSFSIRQRGEHPETVNTVTEEGGAAGPVNVSRYKIRVDVAPPTTLGVEALLQLEVRQGGQRTLLFELSRFLHLKQVEEDGHPVEFIHNQALQGTHLARRGNDLVAVVFPQPLITGQRMQLRFVYGGDVLSEAGGGLLYVGARGTWYPNRGLAMSDYDLEFHYPPGWTLVATGKRVPVPGAGDSGTAATATSANQVTRWVSERPIPIAGFNLGKYTRAAAQAGDVTVEAYAASAMERAFPRAAAEAVVQEPLTPSGLRPELQTTVIVPPPPSPARNAQPVADASARAIDFFARRYGPYPYGDLALTQMPGSLSQGWPGLIFLSSFSFLSEAEKTQLHVRPLDRILSEQVIAHETAHQWWGDLVVWSGYRDQWIMEALANYSSLMMLELENPSQFRALMEKFRDDLLQKDKDGRPLMEAGPVTLGGRLSSSYFPEGYEAITYGRGTWLFHMLRHMLRDAERKSIGRSSPPGGQPTDEPFVRALRSVRERYQGKAVTTRDLLRAFEEQMPPSLWFEDKRSLDWFYEGWVNGTAIPRLGLQGVKYLDKPGGTVVTGTILQRDAPAGLVTSVPLYGTVGKKSALLGRVFADGGETPFRLTAPASTRKVVVDPNQTVLTRDR